MSSFCERRSSCSLSLSLWEMSLRSRDMLLIYSSRDDKRSDF
jgi:hypothetical protein